MLRDTRRWYTLPGGAGRRLFAWWLRELRALLPGPLREMLTPNGRRVLFELQGDALQASVVSAPGQPVRGHQRTLDATDVATRRALMRLRAERVLCLPADRVLRRRIELPMATEENLRQVLGFELDRQTPLNAEEACYDYRLLERDTSRRILDLELAVVPRTVVHEMNGQLQRVGVTVHRASVRGDDGTVLELNLLPEHQRARATRIPLVVNVTLACLAAVLLAVALALPLHQKRAQLEMLEPLVSQARSDAVTARELRATMDALSTQAGFVLEKRLAARPVLDVINEVTQVLPDDTWVRQLMLLGGEVQLLGESTNAALLVQLLESSALLHDVRFRSPVVEDSSAGVERFHLSAELGPEDQR